MVSEMTLTRGRQERPQVRARIRSDSAETESWTAPYLSWCAEMITARSSEEVPLIRVI